MSHYVNNLLEAAKKLIPSKKYKEAQNKARASAGGKQKSDNDLKKKPFRLKELTYDKKHFTSDQAQAHAKANNFAHDEMHEGKKEITLRKHGVPKQSKTVELGKGISGLVAKADPTKLDLPPISNDEIDVEKDGPTGSQVHVASTDWKSNKKKKKPRKRLPVEVMKSSPSGIIVALYLPKEVADLVAMPEGEDASTMHVTLAYVPAVGDDDAAFNTILHAMEAIAEQFGPIMGVIGGHGRFNASETSDAKDVIYVSYDSGELTDLRPAVVSAIEEVAGLKISRKHGFSPHVTIEYIEPGETHEKLISASEEFAIGNITIQSKNRRVDVPLKGACDPITKDDQTSDQQNGQGKGSDFYDKPLKLHVGSGTKREKDHLGIDLYPHDDGTMVHDISLGMPFPDKSASHIKMTGMPDHVDQKGLLAEYNRVLQPGGSLVYDGPVELNDYPPELVQTHAEGNVSKAAEEPGQEFRQEFIRMVQPDAATANDAEPRIESQSLNDLPNDALTALDAIGYTYDDADNVDKGGPGSGKPGMHMSRSDKYKLIRGESVGKESTVQELVKAELSFNDIKQLTDEEVAELPLDVTLVKKALEHAVINEDDSVLVPVMKIDSSKQLVYGVVLEPNSVDAQEDWMTADDIEKAAHHYMRHSRVVGSGHAKPITAHPVESYIVPQDFTTEGQYGGHVVKKGSWVLGVKIDDPTEWEKVQSGGYQAFSVGGFGHRK